MKKKNWRKIFNSILIFVIGMVLWSIISIRKQNSILKYYRDNNEQEYTKFEVIKLLLQNEYIEPEKLTENKDKMLEKAVVGFVDGLEDPYTMYLTAEENKELEDLLHEESWVEGIGAVLEKKENYIQIAEIVKNGPAYNAGLQPLDRILLINSWSTQELSTKEAVAKIRGEKGTEVHLFIQREEKDQETKNFPITIIRESIEIPSVVTTFISEQETKIWLFEISSISEYTTKLFMKDVPEFINQGMQGIILDLRGNNGGYLEEASKFLGHFLSKGETTVKSKYTAYEDKEFQSKGVGELQNYPLVIIIDQLTASAGEIIALTLQEHGATVIGTPSLGKWTIQTVTKLPDGSSIKYTVGKRYSPKGSSINQTGVLPDIEVLRDSKEYQENRYDTQLEKAKEVLINLIQK